MSGPTSGPGRLGGRAQSWCVGGPLFWTAGVSRGEQNFEMAQNYAEVMNEMRNGNGSW
jgi:hypothetical protein